MNAVNRVALRICRVTRPEGSVVCTNACDICKAEARAAIDEVIAIIEKPREAARGDTETVERVWRAIADELASNNPHRIARAAIAQVRKEMES